MSDVAFIFFRKTIEDLYIRFIAFCQAILLNHSGMSLIKGYKYDFFISYSHIDNEDPNARKGWVEKFYSQFNVLLKQSFGEHDVSIWWDNKRLNGSIVFDDSIAEAIDNAAILICLNSPSFLNSDYCQEELKRFVKKASHDEYGLRLNNRSRILNLLLFNIPYAEWPEQLSGTTGFSFHDAKEKDLLGDRLVIGESKFRRQLNILRDAIIGLRDEFKQRTEPSLPSEPSTEFSIYFGDVSDSLSEEKDGTIHELEKKGYKVYSNIPPPYESLQHEKEVMEKLEMAHLNVHLLDQFKGRKIQGENSMWYPQKQLELSLASNKPKLIWIPDDVNINSIEEEKYRDFLSELDSGKKNSGDISYIRGKKSRLFQEIIDRAESLKEKRKQVVPDPYSVLLDTRYDDPMFVMDLWTNLSNQKVRTFLYPQKGDPKTTIQFLKDCISQVKNLVFCYNQNSKEWVKERFIAARQFIIENDFPVKKLLFFLLPPKESPGEISVEFGIPEIDIIDNSFSSQLHNQALQKLLERIKAES